ncbi:MAG TPA: hypothetical protein VF742_09815, partial [Terracidiphilus sp.]
VDDDVGEKSMELISVIWKPIPVSLDSHHVSTDKTGIGMAVENRNFVPRNHVAHASRGSR